MKVKCSHDFEMLRKDPKAQIFVQEDLEAAKDDYKNDVSNDSLEQVREDQRQLQQQVLEDSLYNFDHDTMNSSVSFIFGMSRLLSEI